MNAPYRFVTNCISARGDDIQNMVDQATEVTRKTFLKHCNSSEFRDLVHDLGYQEHPARGLTMASDWAISYWRSWYCGHQCYYFSWSAIEFVFCKEE